MMKQAYDEFVLRVAIWSKAIQTFGFCLICTSLLWDLVKYGTQSFFEYNIGWLGRAIGMVGLILIIVARRAIKSLS